MHDGKETTFHQVPEVYTTAIAWKIYVCMYRHRCGPEWRGEAEDHSGVPFEIFLKNLPMYTN